MINKIINGISAALYEEFGKQYHIYTDEVKQGLKTPCFFVFVNEPESKLFRGKRYYKELPFVVQYIKDETDTSIVVNQVNERLFECLEEINADGMVRNGTDMHSNYEEKEGVLSFFVNYNFYVQYADDAELMKVLKQNNRMEGD